MIKNDLHDIARILADKYGLNISEAKKFTNNFIDLVNEGLQEDGHVKIKGFGAFKIVEVKDRESINVTTGERILIPGRNKITFTPDSVMKELVNKPFSQFDTVVLNDGVDFSDFEQQAEESIDHEEANDDVEFYEATEEEPTSVEEAVIDKAVAAEEPPATVEITVAVADFEAEKELVVEEESETEKEPEYKPNSDGSVFEEEVIIEESTVKIIPIEESAPENQEPVMIQTSALEPDESVTKESTDVSVQQIMDDKQLITNNKPKKEEKKMKHRHGRKKRVAWWIPIGFLFTLAAGIAIGYHIGIRQVPAPLDLVGYEESDSLQDSTAVEIKDTKKATSTTAEEIQKKEKQQETVAGPVELKEEGNKPAKESVEIAPISANDSQVLRNAKQMVSKGAYSIVGTMETVTVRPGQNIKKISKFYLGEGMECYIQAYNNVEEVTEGMKLKIPQVKLKKK